MACPTHTDVMESKAREANYGMAAWHGGCGLFSSGAFLAQAPRDWCEWAEGSWTVVRNGRARCKLCIKLWGERPTN